MAHTPDPTFWQTLPKPLIGLSPMDDITDHAARHITKKYGHPDLIYTEFTSVEGVCHGAERLLKDFLFDEIQRPIIGQIYGTTPDFFRQTAIILCELGYDGIDINMGCPAKNVAHSGAGAALIKQPQLAQAIIAATQAGVNDFMNGQRASHCPDITPNIAQEVARRHALLPKQYQQLRTVPVSVKTRIGFEAEVVDSWIPTLLEMSPAAIALHGRTLKQRYAGQADWDAIGRAAELIHQTPTLILGNGDVTSWSQAQQRVTEYGVDGVLIGKGSWGNPWVFLTPEEQTQTTTSIFEIALEHAQLYEKTFKTADHFHFVPMRKHLGWYIKDFPNAAQVRLELYQTNSAAEVEEILKKHQLI